MDSKRDPNVKQPVSKQIVLIAFGAALILMAPLFAMQFTDEVNWDLFDFIVAGMLLISIGIIYVLSARMLRNVRSRVILAFVLAAVLLLVWAELSIGIFGSPFSGT